MSKVKTLETFTPTGTETNSDVLQRVYTYLKNNFTEDEIKNIKIVESSFIYYTGAIFSNIYRFSSTSIYGNSYRIRGIELNNATCGFTMMLVNDDNTNVLTNKLNETGTTFKVCR